MIANYSVINTEDVEEVKDVEVTVLVVLVLTHLADASITVTHVLL